MVNTRCLILNSLVFNKIEYNFYSKDFRTYSSRWRVIEDTRWLMQISAIFNNTGATSYLRVFGMNDLDSNIDRRWLIRNTAILINIGLNWLRTVVVDDYLKSQYYSSKIRQLKMTNQKWQIHYDMNLSNTG